MQEVKILEEDGYVITSKRFVYDSTVIPLDQIVRAGPFISRGWSGAAIIAGIGLLLISFGGTVAAIIGLLLFPAAFFFFKHTVVRRLLLIMKAGEGPEINVDSDELLHRLVSAVNRAKAEENQRESNALQDELSSLPIA